MRQRSRRWRWRPLSAAVFLCVLLAASHLACSEAKKKSRDDSEDNDDDDSDDDDRSSDESDESEEKSVAVMSHECNGHGDRYCGDAHKLQECPKGCNPWECSEESSDIGDKYDDVIMKGKYDFVYWDPDYQNVCVSYCWRRWKDMRCKRRKTDTVRYSESPGAVGSTCR